MAAVKPGCVRKAIKEELSVVNKIFVNKTHLETCFGNTGSSDYKDKQKGFAACRAVAANMNLEGFGIEDAKKKFHCLQTVFRKEMLRMKAPSGSGAINYKSPILWLGEMEALVRTCEDEDLLENIEIYGHQEESQMDVSYCLEAQITPTVAKDTTKNTKRTVKKRKPDVLLEAVNQLKHVSDAIANPNIPDDILSEYISVEVQELSEIRQLEVRQKLFNLIAEERLKDANDNSERNLHYAQETERLRKENEYLKAQVRKLQKRCQRLEKDYDELTNKFCQLDFIEALDEASNYIP